MSKVFILVCKGHAIGVCASREMAEHVKFMIGPTKTEISIETAVSYIDLPCPVVPVAA